MAEQLGMTGRTANGRYNLQYTGEQLSSLLKKLENIQDLQVSEVSGVITLKVGGSEYQIVNKDTIQGLLNEIERLQRTVRYEEVE